MSLDDVSSGIGGLAMDKLSSSSEYATLAGLGLGGGLQQFNGVFFINQYKRLILKLKSSILFHKPAQKAHFKANHQHFSTMFRFHITLNPKKKMKIALYKSQREIHTVASREAQRASV